MLKKISHFVLSVRKWVVPNSIRKGKAGEREIANLLKEEGFISHRISMMETQGTEEKGDIILDDNKCEVKIGGNVPKWLYSLFKTEDIQIGFIRRDRERWFVVLELPMFLRLWKTKGGVS